MMQYQLFYDGVSSVNFGMYVGLNGNDNAPQRSIDTIVVPGRNGTLTIDNGRFENIEIEYICFIRRDFEKNIISARNHYTSRIGYKRLEDTAHPDEYRMARYVSGLEVTPSQMRKQGYFTLTFDAMPQRFLKSGEKQIAFTRNGAVVNATQFDAKPLIRVYGDGVVGIGSETITVADNPGYIDIDCEMMDAYMGATNCNSNITLSSDEFPVLTANSNSGVTLGTGITKVVITPRWYII